MHSFWTCKDCVYMLFDTVALRSSHSLYSLSHVVPRQYNEWIEEERPVILSVRNKHTLEHTKQCSVNIQTGNSFYTQQRVNVCIGELFTISFFHLVSNRNDFFYHDFEFEHKQQRRAYYAFDDFEFKILQKNGKIWSISNFHKRMRGKEKETVVTNIIRSFEC